MKNSKWLALLLVFVLVSALMPSALAADYVEPFTDVPVKQYYAEPVSWAVAEEITNGVSKTEFAPNKTCTRRHVPLSRRGQARRLGCEESLHRHGQGRVA